MGDKFVASLVHNKLAKFALVTLLAKTPAEITTMATECELLEEFCHKLVPLHFVNFGLSHGTATFEVVLLSLFLHDAGGFLLLVGNRYSELES